MRILIMLSAAVLAFLMNVPVGSAHPIATDGAGASELSHMNLNLEEVFPPLNAAVSVSGVVTGVTPKNYEAVRVVFLRVMRTPDFACSYDAFTSQVDDKGKFVMEGIPEGVFDLFVTGLPAGSFVREIRSGNADALANGLQVGQKNDSVKIVIGETARP